LVRLLAELGGTPSSRSRVSIDGEKEEDPFDQFLKQGGKPYGIKGGKK